jgi:Family of unknown function (DUF6314)/Flavin-binding monooxygenase-like
MVEICVIGAGAAGLVVSRHLLAAGLTPFILEQGAGVGGLWNGRLWRNLQPNLSKYTVRFSDWPWNDEDEFVSQAQVGQYLQQYASTYLPRNVLHMNCRVQHVASLPGNQFRVDWIHQQQPQSKVFPSVVLASGFFCRPKWPSGVSPDLQQPNHLLLHSSQYDDPKMFVSEKQKPTIAVIGSSFSALEIISDLILHGHEARGTSSTEDNLSEAPFQILHVMHEPPYVIPRYISDEDGLFLPVDQVLYTRRHDIDPDSAPVSTIAEQHEQWRSRLGRRLLQQLPLSPSTTAPPCVAISDDYARLLADGHVQVHRGRLSHVSNGGGGYCLHLQDGTTLPADHVVAATGYDSPDFGTLLSPDLLETLEWRNGQTADYAPLTLCHETWHPALPTLGFIGLYKGPYFGSLELQARFLLAQLQRHFQTSDDTTFPLNFSEQDASVALAESRRVRGLDSNPTPRPRFPHGDYIRFMDTLARTVNLLPTSSDNDTVYGNRGTMVSPAFYQVDQPDLARQCFRQLQQERERARGGAHVALATWRALVGSWSMDRTISECSLAATAPPTTVTGMVQFRHVGTSFDALRYREDGSMKLPGGSGTELTVFREYDYLVTPDGSNLEIYFVENGKRTYLFMGLKFVQQQEKNTWLATSDHLCIKDLYRGTFEVVFDGISIEKMTMKYRVQGPAKDYESITVLLPA